MDCTGAVTSCHKTAIGPDKPADDLSTTAQSYEVTCPLASYHAIVTALAEKNIPTELSEISMIAQDSITLDAQTAPKVLSLLEKLEDQDDVQNVYSNFDISDDIFEEYAARQ